MSNPACNQQLTIESLLHEQTRLHKLIAGLQDQLTALGTVVQHHKTLDDAPDRKETIDDADDVRSVVSIPANLTLPLPTPVAVTTAIPVTIVPEEVLIEVESPALFDAEHDEPL
jgi:hypothetical protein